MNNCQICNIQTKLTKHHLIPKVKDKFKQNLTINICSNCHTFLHANFSESELRDNLNSLEKILNNEICKKYINWRIKHPNFNTNSTKKSNKLK